MLLNSIAVISLIGSCILGSLLHTFRGLTLLLIPVWYVVILLVLLVLAFLFLYLCCRRIDLQKEQTQDSPFYRRIMHLYIEALISLVGVRIHGKGLENIPTHGRFLLVCNHLHLADPALLLHCLPKSQLAFITKKENQSLFIVGKLMHKILCQPIDRENDRAALKTILKCISLIKEDKCSIGVFPEGYTSRDGRLHHFRSGVFKIAQKANVPIVVCTVRNSQDIFANLAKLKKTHVHVHLLETIPPEEIKGLSTVEISDRIYNSMIADLGEEFRV